MNPLTVNPAIALQYARQVREVEMRTPRRRDRATRASRAARVALERAGQ
jgi:hypothetical protein